MEAEVDKVFLMEAVVVEAFLMEAVVLIDLMMMMKVVVVSGKHACLELVKGKCNTIQPQNF